MKKYIYKITNLINGINQGKNYKNKNFSYSLRPSNKRVYNQNL